MQKSQTAYEQKKGFLFIKGDRQEVNPFREKFQKIMGACGTAAAGKRAIPGTHPSLALGDYTGIYEHPGFGCIELKTRDDRLEGTFSGLNIELEHYHFDVFRIKNSILKGTKICFHLGSGGEVKSLTMPLEQGVPDIVFKHIEEKRGENGDSLEKHGPDPAG